MKSDRTEQTSTAWINSAKHHLFQLGKGGIVAGLTLGGYGLWKWWQRGNSTADVSQPKDLVETQQEISKHNEQLLNHPILTVNYLQEKSIDPVTAGGSPKIIDVSFAKEPIVLSEELGIFFHPKEHLLNKHTSTEKSTITTHTIDLDNPELEEITVIVGEKFRIRIPGYKVEGDDETDETYYFGTMNATLAHGSPLPPWFSIESPTTSFNPKIIGTADIGTASDTGVFKDIVLVAAWAKGVQPFNISDPRNPRMTGRKMDVPGYANFIVLYQNLALVTDFAAGLLLIDISDPKYPTMLSRKSMPDDTFGITVQDNLVAIAASSAGLQLVNISDPRHPNIIGSHVFPGHAIAVALQDDLAFIASSWVSSLRVVNISNPHQPTPVSSLEIPGNAYALDLQGDLVLVAALSGGLQLVNISNPKQPQIIGSQILPGYPFDISIKGDLAFLATAEPGGLAIVNITNPAQPYFMKEVDTNSGGLSIRVYKNLAFVGCRKNLQIIELNTWSWYLLGNEPITEYGNTKTIHFEFHSRLTGISYNKTIQLYTTSRPYLNNPIPNIVIKPENKFVYQFTSDFLDKGDGVIPFERLTFSLVQSSKQLPDWLQIGAKQIISKQAYSDWVCDIAIQNNIAIVAARSDGLQLVDISDPKDPRFISRKLLPGDALGIVIQDNLALVAADESGLQIIDVSNPMYPLVIGNQTLPGNSMSVAVQGDLALLAAGSGGLQLVDISDPRLPTVIASQILPDAAWGVTVQDNLALIAARSSGLYLFDISNPHLPILTGHQRLPGFAHNVFINRNFAYVAAHSGGLQIVDIRNPKRPVIASSLTFSDDAWDVVVEGDFALVSTRVAGLQLVDIKNPNQPSYVGSTDTSGEAYSVATYNDVVLAGSDAGLDIIQLGLSIGVLSGYPFQSDHNKYQLVISARNSDNIIGNATFWLSVNHIPIWKIPIAKSTVNVGQVVSFQLPEGVFWDQDGDTLTYKSLFNADKPLPHWITFFAAGQIYTMAPGTNDRGEHNISVIVDDGYFGQAKAWFLLTIPTRQPIKVSDIPSQHASIWRLFELFVSPDTFRDLDGGSLSYRAQLKGSRPLPNWLQFENLTCVTGCRFVGVPGVTDFSNLEVELIAKSLGGEIGASFTITISTNTVFADLATYYSVSGGGLVFLYVIGQLYRVYRMGKLRKEFSHREQNREQKTQELSRPELERSFTEFRSTVESRITSQLSARLDDYVNAALVYSKNGNRLTDVGNFWGVIKEICEEVKARNLRKFSYQETLVWADVLYQLLQLVIDIEMLRRRILVKSDKESLLEIIGKAEKYIETDKNFGVQLKHKLSLSRAALVMMGDTDSIIDNLCCRDHDMLIDILKTMLVPPFGALRLLYQMENIPAEWYFAIMQLSYLAKQAPKDSQKLIDFQKLLKKQKDWRTIYEGIGLLGQIAQKATDEKLSKQAIEGVQAVPTGLKYYLEYNKSWFLDRCSPCCKKSDTWIRDRAREELESYGVTVQGYGHIGYQELKQPLLTW